MRSHLVYAMHLQHFKRLSEKHSTNALMIFMQVFFDEFNVCGKTMTI
jgi:hypothetical protein